MQYNGLLCHLYIYIYVCLHLVQKTKYIYILYCIYIIYLYKKSTIIYKLQSMYSWRIAGYTALWLVKKILTKVLGTSPQPAHSRIQPDKHVRIDKNVVVHMDRVLHLIPPLYVYIYTYILSILLCITIQVYTNTLYISTCTTNTQSTRKKQQRFPTNSERSFSHNRTPCIQIIYGTPRKRPLSGGRLSFSTPSRLLAAFEP